MTQASRLRTKATEILLANRAKTAGDAGRAREHFRRAAALEEEIFRELAAQGRPDFLINAISAVSCWTEAGEHQNALSAAGHALTLAKGTDVDEHLVRELSELAAVASERDADEWYAERTPTSSQDSPDPIDLGTEHEHLLDEYVSKLEALPVLT